MGYIFKESNNEKKIDKVRCKYEELLKKTNNKSKQILLLVPNNNSRLVYLRSLNLEYSEELNIITYLGFIKRELVKYWPIVIEKCEKIDKKLISPQFISNSLSEYIMTEKVSKERRVDGYFEDITATNRSIATSINTNINKAALSLIDYKTIGEKIYLSKKNRNNLLRFSYSQMDEIINYYTNILLSNSMIDNPLSIYLYNNYLLNDERYVKSLKKDIKYIIVESLEGCSTAEVDFIEVLLDNEVDGYMYFNFTRDYSVFNNIDLRYIKQKIIDKYSKNELINNQNYEFIEDICLADIYSLPTKINLNQSSQLYSEMIDKACDMVMNLINNGSNPKDIAVISPINNAMLDHQVKNILNKNNIDVFNSKKDRRIIDYPYGNVLLVATCLFYGYEELIKDEEYISFIEIILNVNRIKAYKIYKDSEHFESFNKIIDYISSKKNNNIKINEFLMQFYIDKMFNLKNGKENVDICKKIINESETFIKNISLLNLDKSKKKEKIFIEALKTNINDFYSSMEMEDGKNLNKVLITTPYSYISSNSNRKIQIWVDIGSNAWNMKIEKELSNVVVLRKSFEERRIYTDIMEESYKKYYLYNMIYSLLVNSKEVYTFKSEYSINGYIQESILYGLLLKLVDKGGRV
ncbi:MAG: hypothetical protein RRZ84_06475 [Romboutsia sp.]